MSRILSGAGAVRHPPVRSVVTVGVFDGVHLAHQRLLRAAVSLARRLKGTSVAVTFDPDPHAVLHPSHVHPSLMPLEARLAQLRALGIDLIWVLPFSRRFARMTPVQFVDRILLRRLRAHVLIVGEQFAFGRGRSGDMRLLRSLGASRGLRIISVPQVMRGGAAISSSRIRALIARGHLAPARGLLGRAPELYGLVVRGMGRGRHLGFPTANLRILSDVLPPRGVYAVRVFGLDARAGFVRLGDGIMNLGVRPTFGPGPQICEVHLLNFSGALLGREVSVALIRRLRGERCFASPNALARQIGRDRSRARRLLAAGRV